MAPHSIHVVSSDSALRRALVARLGRSPDLSLPTTGWSLDVQLPGRIVVVPASECSPGACRDLVARGHSVIVLAAVLRDNDRERYLAAGAAAYVPMTVDSEQLLEALRMAAGEHITPLPASPVARTWA
jgi:DNA-binding NarL/FixJ family response regulator